MIVWFSVISFDIWAEFIKYENSIYSCHTLLQHLCRCTWSPLITQHVLLTARCHCGWLRTREAIISHWVPAGIIPRLKQRPFSSVSPCAENWHNSLNGLHFYRAFVLYQPFRAHSPIHTHFHMLMEEAAMCGNCSSGIKKTHSPTNGAAFGSNGVGLYLAQRHFGTQIGGAKDRIANLPIGGWPTLPSQPQMPQIRVLQTDF